jgi:GMP synthase (glutamine-hydrolysing)
VVCQDHFDGLMRSSVLPLPLLPPPLPPPASTHHFVVDRPLDCCKAMNILVVQHIETAPLGVLGECLQARGDHLEILIPTRGDLLPSTHEGFDALLILAGPMNAGDDVGYPHLRKTIDLIHQFHATRKPLLGICLGAQIIARAFGKRVYRHEAMEIGFTPVFFMDAAIEDPLLQSPPQKLCLMQWHFDTFDLPDEATLLMFGKTCLNQAFRIGNHIYGFQFHFEVTREIVQSWIHNKEKIIEENYPDLSQSLDQQMEKYLEGSNLFCQKVGTAWLDLVRKLKR